MLTKALTIIDELLPLCRCDYGPTAADVQRAYCYRQLHFVQFLARESVPLLSQPGGYAAAIVSRSIVESLLRMGAAAESEETCLRILFTDASEDSKRSRFFREVYPEPGDKWDKLIDGYEGEMRALSTLTPTKLKSIDLWGATPPGGLRNLYRSTYHVLSQVAHGKYTIIDQCLKGRRLAGDREMTIVLFVCLAGIVASELFEVGDGDFVRRLNECHPDLKRKKG